MTKKDTSNYILLGILILLLIINSLPIISMIGTSLKTESDSLATTSLFPKLKNIYFGSYADIWKHTDFPRNIWNSGVVSIFSSIICVVFASLGGYSLSRFKGLFFTLFITFLLLLQMLPLILILIPTFVIYRTVGLNNTLTGLIINYASTSLAFSILLLKSFFDTVPKEIEEAAMIDGCSRVQSFVKVIIPISNAGLSTVSIFVFVKSWNEYMVSKVLIQSESLKTINLGLQQFVQQFNIDWSKLSAAAMVATIPTIIFLLFAQKYLVQGMTMGAVKG
jgi:ABC-type glycerol-3-phosphate transport system permease component